MWIIWKLITFKRKAPDLTGRLCWLPIWTKWVFSSRESMITVLKFKAVGGIDTRVLVGKRVRIGKDGVPGVIGYKPIHLQDSTERQSTVKKSGLTIDIGAKDRDQAEQSVSVGDTAAFDYDPVEFGDHKVMAKALDDRVGCVILTELLKSRYSFDLYGCFTVQEEIGLKGAKAASYAVVPDVAIILEGTTCYDLTGTSEHMIEYETR